MANGFDEIQLPADISGSIQGGPTFSTTVIGTSSGAEQRIGQWSRGRLRWTVGHGLKTQDEIEGLIAFFRARFGKLRGFRFKDWSDYKLCFEEPQLLSATSYQVVKPYTSGGSTETRIIRKLVQGTIRIFKPSASITFSVPATATDWVRAPMTLRGDQTGFTVSPDGVARLSTLPESSCFPEGAYPDPDHPYEMPHLYFLDERPGGVADPSAVVQTTPPGRGPAVCPQLPPYSLALANSYEGTKPPATNARRSSKLAILQPNDGATFGEEDVIAAHGCKRRDIYGIFNDEAGFNADNDGGYSVTITASPGPTWEDVTGEWTIDHNTGIINHGSGAPGYTPLICGEFDVPVRFDSDEMNFTIEDAMVRSWDSVPIIEVLQ